MHFLPLLFLVGTLISSHSASVLQGSGDDCLSALTSSIYQAGLPLEETAEILWCRQLPSGNWTNAVIADTRTFKRIIPTDLAQLVSQGQEAVRADIRTMLRDRRFSQWFTYDIDTGEFVSPGLTNGNDMKKGKVFQDSLKGEAIMSPPGYLSTLRDEYENAAYSYLLDPSNSTLAGYATWLMNRRDAAILALTASMDPFFTQGTQQVFRYGRIPWPWELADPFTIESALLWVIQSEGITPQPTPAQTTQRGTTTVADVWLNIRAENESDELLAGACFEVIGPIPASRAAKTQTICDGDSIDVPGTPGVVIVLIAQGRYQVYETQPPSGYRLNSEVKDFYTSDQGVELTFQHAAA